MRQLLIERPKADKGSFAVSLVLNAIWIAIIGSITFTYEFHDLFPPRYRPQTEHVQYVVPQPRSTQPVGNGSREKEKPKKTVRPAELLPPTTIPTAIPPVPPPSVSAGAISGTATGSGGAPAGVATGIEPSLPDPRIELHPNTLHVPISIAQRNDSAVQAIYQAYREAEIASEAARGRNPRDWTVQHGDQKYGIDSQYVYLGKFKIPSAILAALPLNFGGVDGHRLIENRNADWIRDDIYTHSQGLSEDDFRAAVRRIRERKEREKKEAEDKAAGKTTPPTPIIVP
ncbi:MAG TPA: hypothetical protein VHV78_14330 [Gemmatimonadaceae bacterium]|jgi:hypothetical protein|nr:hypothetical protein [Gemmatimonadaceae bacterium]